MSDNCGSGTTIHTTTMTIDRRKPKDFEALLAKSRLKESAASIARAVLVDGMGYAEAGKLFGKNRQFAYQAVTRLLESEQDEPQVHTYEGPAELFAEQIDKIVEAHKGRKMLTARQFKIVSALTRQSDDSIELARGVLVDGQENIKLANAKGIARHLPWQAAQRFMAHFDATAETTRVYRGSAAMFAEIDALLARKK